MHRKRFIRLSGAGIASLFFSPFYAQAGGSRDKRLSDETRRFAGGGFSGQTLHFPSKVEARIGGQWTPLSGSKEHWSYRQLTVSLKHVDSMLVQIHAPGLSLEKIRLSWDLVFPSSAAALGDQWERSYGDLAWLPVSTPRKAPWYLLVNDGKQTHAFGVKTGAKSFCSWQLSPQKLELLVDTLSGGEGVQPGDRVLDAAEIITMQGVAGETPFQTDTRFCKMMCDKPILPEKPVYGINDWYFAYGNNSKALILESTRSMVELAQDTNNRPFSVIDDGWQVKFPENPNDICWGEDFSKPNEKFGDMSTVAAEIKRIGMRPGLWTRPLLANKMDKATLLTPIISGKANQKERYLDPTLPENLQRIGDIIRLYKDWGFEMVKHDYTSFDFFGRWGLEMKEEMTVAGWHFNDRSRTNAEILLDLYATIRRAAGSMYLIGCNTVSNLSAGMFELCRTGDDTSGKEWSRTLKMGVNTMGFRLPQHNAFYAVDGDCVGLTTQVPWKYNRQWLQLLAESSAPLFISAQPEATGAEQRAMIKKSYDLAARPQPLGEPLDWMSNPRPAKWRLNDRIVDFDWEL